MANGQTIIKYGDVNFYHCSHQVEQKAEFDSGRSLKYWRFTISGTGLIHGYNSSCAYFKITEDPAPTTPTSAAVGMKQVRWRLKPRQDFTLAVGCTSTSLTSGVKLIEANAMTNITTIRTDLAAGLTNFDVDDGPRCLFLRTIATYGNNTMRVEFAFEVCLLQCNDDAQAPDNTNGVVSHRWAVTDSLDTNRRTTRTYRGHLEIATSNFSPHWFRHLVVPPLQYGFRRDGMEFTATEDGKHLQYTVLDTEVAIAAPAPATKWNIDHSETTLNQDGLKVCSSVKVDLEGEPNCDAGQLILLGLWVVSAKLVGSAPGVPVDETIFFNDITIAMRTGDSQAVSVSASCWRPAKDIGGLGVANRAVGFNKQIEFADLPAFSANYSPIASTDARAGESTRFEGSVQLAGIFRCFLQNSCQPGKAIDYEPSGDETESAGTGATVPASIRIVPTISEGDVSYYSESHQNANYTTYQVEGLNKKRTGKIALPIARRATVANEDLRDSVAIVSVCGAIAERTVRIVAERVGADPEFPDGETMDGVLNQPGSGYATEYGSGYPPIQQVLMRETLMGRGRTRSANGQTLHHAQWEGTYALRRAPMPNEIRKIGVSKWESSGGTVSTTTLTNSPY